ncbi:MAG: hypothetical protein PHQ67_06375 [Fermentimonas sp.]|nr:hypothetical protein [Fermentimonas sp.]
MRQGKVYYNNDLAGIITETDDGEYLFAYDNDYIRHLPEDTEEMALTIKYTSLLENRLNLIK